MLPSKDLAVRFLTLWIFVNNAKCQDLNEMSKTLDEMLGNSRSFRRPRDHEETSIIWQEYEFGTGAGNREEVVVTNISLHSLANITQKINISENSWQCLQMEASYFICAENATLFFYKINWDDLSVEHVISIPTEGDILQFKVLNLNVEATFNENRTNNLMALLLVKSQRDCFLYWYAISGNAHMLYFKWQMQKQIQDMEFVRGKIQHELLLLHNDDAYLEQSLIEIYGFDVDHSNHRIHIWLCWRSFVPKVFNAQVCPIYGRPVLAFQGVDSVVLYESKSQDKSCQFEKLKDIKSNKLTHFACFESGYIKYLAIGGEELHLFHIFEDDFQNNAETSLHFDETTKIVRIVAIPLDTYRDESLLLVELKNLTVLALAWHGSRFKVAPLSSQVLNNFNLSKIVVIPKIGFVHVNTLVRIQVSLSESAHPIHHETESVLKTRALLEEVFRKQEAIFDKTEVQFNQSYLASPVTAAYWNLAKVNVSNATIERHVNYDAIKVGSVNLEMKDVSINVTSNLKKLEELETRLDRILPELKNVTNSAKIFLPDIVELTGDFLVNGTLRVKNLTAAFINNASTSTVASDLQIANRDIINGQKSFPSIDADNLTVFSLNGIPLEEIVFDFTMRNYSDVNLSKLKRLKVDGHLSFSKVNNITWEELMQGIVWKDGSTIISGETIVEGLVAEEPYVSFLNGLSYPENYVSTSGIFSTNITGEKHFTNLSVEHLLGIAAINKINIDDFIIPSRHKVIDAEITFENLEIEGTFQIDGNVTGTNVSSAEGLLNETDSLLSAIIFESLTVVGDIVLKNSINAKTWLDLDDFLLKTENDALIIGNKTFWSAVNINSRAKIQSRRINHHLFSEFVTLNSNQQFPHLTRISANVLFENATLGTMKKLEHYITHEQDTASGCLNKILLFIKSSIVDDLSFDTIRQTISQATFLDKINKTLRQVHFENLTVSTLLTDEILPNTINGLNYSDLATRALTLYARQNLTGALIVDNLETDTLDVEMINGVPLNTWNLSLTNAKSLYDDVFHGNAAIRSLRVTGMITASSINDNDIIDIYKEDDMATVTFNKNVSIENLRVIGFVNNLNLAEFIADTVQKDERNIAFTGHKTFRNVTCDYLGAQFVNGHFINDILNPNETQTLKGPVIINGSVVVFKNFNTTGKIGNSVYLSDFTDSFELSENNSYVLRGNFCFTEAASITKLNVNGSIEGSTLDSFLDTVIFRNDTDITIFGLKLFKHSVTFNDAFNIAGSLNDLDLHGFHKNVVYIDKPFAIDSKVTFRKDVHLQKDLVVKTRLQSNTIMGVDIKDLQENVVALNMPKYFSERMTLDNVTFQTSIKTMQVNDLQLDQLILLNTRQFITIDKLNCTNVTVRNIQTPGRINTYDLEDIYSDTFMIYGNQNITGHIKIGGNIYAHHDFNAHLINNFNPTKIISLTTNDTVTGNFMSKTPIVLDKSLRTLGLLNGIIDSVNWQEKAIRTTGEAKQIVSGKWRVHGNVHFKENVDGSEFLNQVNVTDISLALTKEYPEIDQVIEDTYEDLNNICAAHLDILKCNTMNQIYKFNAFDYLKIQEFEGDIHDIRNVEVNDVDYMLVNYNICHIKLLSYTQTDFQVIDEVFDFGLIDQWMFFKSNRVLYLLTIAKHACGRSLNNIWKLEDNRLMHVLELGNVTDMNLHQDEFETIIREKFESASENVNPDILKDIVSYRNEKLNSVSSSDLIVLANQSLTYKLEERSLNSTYVNNCLDCGILFTFKVGIYGREEYIHYDERVSQDYIYLYKSDISQTRILQTIKARRPKSFLILDFGGSVETLLVFVENDDIIQVYEYTGIEGFVHRNMIQIKVDKLYNFKIRKYTNLEKRRCLAVVHKNRLTILEAKMYGEKLDSKTLDMDFCYINKC